jgi:hypothetical protein
MSAMETRAVGWEFAEQHEGPLFKFRGFDIEKDINPDYQGYAASLLRDGLIYCASSFEMNDPWEGRPAFSVPPYPFEHPKTQAFVEALLDGQPDQDKPRWRALLKKTGLERHCNEMQDMHRDGHKTFGVYSMSANCVHPLQWGYYANGHRGFCWMFSNKVAPFSRAARVSYESDHPEVDWARWKELNLVRLSFLIKARHWSHEDEYRILLPQRDSPEHFSVVPHNGRGPKGLGRYLKVPVDAVHGVIFGQAMRHSEAGAIVRTAREYGRNLEFRCALLHRRKFEMATRLLSPKEVERLSAER